MSLIPTPICALLGLCAILGLAACSPGPSYYWQAAVGQGELIAARRPTTEIESDPQATPQLKSRLQLANQMRDFASSALALPDNNSYRSYADLQRQFALWNVFAAPPLSLTSQTWCMPVSGCVSYLGFFTEADAKAEAERLRAAGQDVHIGGIAAYSTLGWFDDPLLNTFINWPEPELARLIFHELAHQQFYVKGDTEFNESFAAAVEEAGLQRWLAQPGKAAQQNQFGQAQQARADFATLILKYREALGAIYASTASDADKAAQKHHALAAMRAEYEKLKAENWGGYKGYDRWFAQDINNASLNSVGFYKALVPAFLAMLAAHHNDLPAFYAAAAQMADLTPAERRAMLNKYLQQQ